MHVWVVAIERHGDVGIVEFGHNRADETSALHADTAILAAKTQGHKRRRRLLDPCRSLPQASHPIMDAA